MQENVTYMQHNKLAYSIREMSELIGICERKIHYENKFSARQSREVFNRKNHFLLFS